MEYLLPDNFEVINTRIIDWYDGIVAGLLRIKNFDCWLHVNVVAIDESTRNKIYLALILNDDQAQEYTDALECNLDRDEKWNRLQKLNKQLSQSYSKAIHIIACKDLESGSTTVTKPILGELSLSQYIGMDYEEAFITESYQNWMKYF